MRVGVMYSYATNLGNGVISEGAVYLVKEALPGAEVTRVSNLSAYAVHSLRESGLNLVLRKIGILKPKYLDVYSFKPLLQELDLFIIPGCWFDKSNIQYILPIIRDLKKLGIPYLVVGAGGGDYSEESKLAVLKLLREYPPTASIVRDSDAESMFSKLKVPTHRGIDLGFFINDAVPIPESRIKQDYLVVVSDRVQFSYPKQENVIYAHHNLSDLTVTSRVYRLLYSLVHRQLKRENGFVFVSDILEDYLRLYARAKEVHTDRLHAAVVSLAYGTPVQLHHYSARHKLLEGIVGEEIYKKPVTADPRRLSEKKKATRELFRSVVESVMDQY